MGVKNGLATALNALRQEASSQFQEVVPIVDENTSIESYSAPLLNTPKFMNEFCDVLVQRIIYTQLETKVFKNPLKVLEGDRIPLGYLGQEIFINPAEGRDYDVNDFAGALKKYESDTKVQYMYINFDKQYPVTLIKQSLKQAFVSWNALEEYIAGLTNSLYNGYYIDEYKNTKALVTNAYRSNAVQIQKIEAPTTTDLAKKFVKQARVAFLNFQTPSSNYNAWKKVGGYGRDIVTFTEASDIVMLIRNDIRAELDVEVLAQAFNMNKADLMGNILTVDNFDILDKQGKVIYDGSKILGIICDKAWFRIKEQDMFMDDFRNANNRSINYYLNVIKMFNYSFFANAIVFATEEPTVAITGLDFKAGTEGIVMDKVGDEKGLDITVTPASANSPKIVYSSDNEGIFTVDEDPNDNRHCKLIAVGQGTANLTATAGNVSTKVKVTVTNA